MSRSAPRPSGDPAAAFQAAAGVSRETLDRLRTYAELLRKWQGAINLVARSTVDDLWRRHMLDSAQLHPLLPAGTRVLVDLGSGAGFPGLVLAILGVPEVHLIESDTRKAAFLREVARATATPVEVHAERIERVAPFPADAVTARALAPMSDLLALSRPFLGPRGVALFPKGRQAEEELVAAAKSWRFAAERFPSLTDPDAVILRLHDLSRIE